LKQNELQSLHKNKSFNTEEPSFMQESLHFLCPPLREELIAVVREADNTGVLQARLKASSKVEHKLRAASIIYLYVIKWFEPFRVQLQIKKSIAAAEKKNALLNARNNLDDDLYK